MQMTPYPTLDTTKLLNYRGPGNADAIVSTGHLQNSYYYRKGYFSEAFSLQYQIHKFLVHHKNPCPQGKVRVQRFYRLNSG